MTLSFLTYEMPKNRHLNYAVSLQIGTWASAVISFWASRRHVATPRPRLTEFGPPKRRPRASVETVRVALLLGCCEPGLRWGRNSR